MLEMLLFDVDSSMAQIAACRIITGNFHLYHKYIFVRGTWGYKNISNPRKSKFLDYHLIVKIDQDK